MRTLESRKITIGSEVLCHDGACGRLRRVVVEPIERVVTHMIVKPSDRARASRVVSLGAVRSVEPGKPGRITLCCSLSDFESLERAHARHFLAGARGYWGYRQEQMLSWPHYRLVLDGAAGAAIPRTGSVEPATGIGVRPHGQRRAILGEVRVRRGDHVRALDGPLGRVRGLIVDRSDHSVTHVLIDGGRIRSRTCTAVPVGSVIDLNTVTYGVRVDLTKDQVGDLPAVELDIRM